MPKFNPDYPDRLLPEPGDWVAYVLATGKSAGYIRYGHIVAVHHSPDTVNIVIKTDGLSDFDEGEPGAEGILWVQDVPYASSEEGNLIKDTWHWPDTE